MTRVDDLFKQLQNQAAAQTKVRRQDAFQERIVKQLLRYAGVSLQVKKSEVAAQDRYGNPSLNFQWFNDAFAFPVQLIAEKISFTHQATLADLYGQGRFKKLPWWVEYSKQVEARGIDLQVERAALIFNLPHAKDAFLMVLHNQPTQEGLIMDAENRVDEPWPRTTFPVGKGIVAVLESFKSFMQTVGVGWVDR